MESNVKVSITGIDKSKAAFDSVHKNLDKVAKATDTAKSRMERMQPVFEKMAVLGTAAFVGITAVATKSIAAYAESERSQRQLFNAVVNVSKGTQEQVTQINALTAALEKKAGVDADSLNMGVAQLSTFGLQSESVVNLTKSLADLTVNQSGVNATSDEYIQQANNIAKALNGQFGILERSGIRFTEAQQSIILYGTETEKVAALQEGLNQNLRETTDTIDGVDLATARLKRTMENINESIGAALSPALVSLSEKLLPILERMGAWAEQNPELVEKIVLVSAAIAGLVAAMGAITLAVMAFNPVSVAIILTLTALASIIYALRNAFEMLGLTWSQIWEGIKTSTAIAVDVVFPLFEKLKMMVLFVKDFVSQFGFTWTQVWDSIKSATLTAVDAMLGPLDEIVSAVAKALEALASLPGVSSGISITKNAFKSVSDLFRADGGPVNAGQGYIVGERGPEWFQPRANGTIIPNNQLAMAGAGVGGGHTYIFNVQGDITERIKNSIMRDLQRNTKL